jgi:hypothetical protein
MKKYLLALLALFVASFVFSQDSTLLDGLNILADAGGQIIASREEILIPGINNSVTGAIIGLVFRELVAVLFRKAKKRKQLKKNQIDLN